MTTSPQREPVPQLSEAELKAIRDADAKAQERDTKAYALMESNGRLTVAEKHRAKLLQHISYITAQLEYAQGYKEGLEDVNQTLAKERDTARAQLEQAQGERDTAVKVAKSLGQTKESLEDEIAAIKNLNIDLQRERDDLVAEIDVKRRRNEELYRELTASREQVTGLLAAIDAMCAEGFEDLIHDSAKEIWNRRMKVTLQELGHARK